MEVEKPGKELRENKEILSFLFAILIIGFLVAFSGVSNDSNSLVDKNRTADQSDNYTKYQENFVDCPDKYMGLCTKMSKLPTEKVEFERAEDDKLYLNLPNSNRSLIAKIQEEGKNGYLIRIED